MSQTGRKDSTRPDAAEPRYDVGRRTGPLSIIGGRLFGRYSASWQFRDSLNRANIPLLAKEGWTLQMRWLRTIFLMSRPPLLTEEGTIRLSQPIYSHPMAC